MGTFTIDRATLTTSKNPELVSPTSWYSTRDGLKTQMKKKWNLYKDTITTVSLNSAMPAGLIFSFMMIESGGVNEIGKSGLYPGLMKFNRTLVYERIEKEKNSNRMSAAEEKILNDNNIYLTKKSDGTYKLTGSGLDSGTKHISTNVMLVPKFNITISAMLLGQYFDAIKEWIGYDENSPTSKTDALKVFACMAIRYNAGMGNWDNWKDRIKPLSYNKLGSKAYASFLPLETRVYVKKLLGANGAMDIAYNDLGINY
jgi:hypothetical protein